MCVVCVCLCPCAPSGVQLVWGEPSQGGTRAIENVDYWATAGISGSQDAMDTMLRSLAHQRVIIICQHLANL